MADNTSTTTINDLHNNHITSPATTTTHNNNSTAPNPIHNSNQRAEPKPSHPLLPRWSPTTKARLNGEQPRPPPQPQPQRTESDPDATASCNDHHSPPASQSPEAAATTSTSTPPTSPQRRRQQPATQQQQQQHSPQSISPPSTSSSAAAASASSGCPTTPPSAAACGCTKIAIMQLFHEMKQEFATVPDYLVCQRVSDHCHNRPQLLASLRLEAARQPATVQAYPQALRQQSHQQHLQQLVQQQHQQQQQQPQPNHPSATNLHSHLPSVAGDTGIASGDKQGARPHRPPPSPPARPVALARRLGLRNASAFGQPNAAAATSPSGLTTTTTMTTKTIANSSIDLSQSPESESARIINGPAAQQPASTRSAQPAAPPHATFRPKVPERPSTLSLPPIAVPVPSGCSNSGYSNSGHSASPQRPHPAFNAPILPVHRQISQPTRTAPRPPFASSTATPSPPLAVSVNVTVAQPAASAIGANRQPHATGRHTSELSMQPELWQRPPPSTQPAAAANGSGGGVAGAMMPMRSFTSVQFQLRSPTPVGGGNGRGGAAGNDTTETSFSLQAQPAATTFAVAAQQRPAPIDISAGPSLLTYSSASYDARKGLHSNFQITVDGGGNGTISAMRSRPPPTPQQQQQTVATQGGTHTTMSSASTGAAGAGILPAMRLASHSHSSWDEADIVHRRLQCKQRLCVELENNRMRLSRMKHEIEILQSPIPRDGASQLDADIERLQASCKQLVQLVEEAGPYVLGETNEAFYHQVISSQTPAAHNQQQRPPRPPPPSPLQRSPAQLGISSAGLSSAPASFSPGQPFTNNAMAHSLSPTAGRLPAAGAGAANHFDRLHHHHAAMQPLQFGGQPHNQSQPQQESPPSQLLPWACNMCTFQNHPLLNKCEQCEMPLLTTSGTVPTQTVPFVSHATGAAGDDDDWRQPPQQLTALRSAPAAASHPSPTPSTPSFPQQPSPSPGPADPTQQQPPLSLSNPANGGHDVIAN